jgi:hypothetical protein
MPFSKETDAVCLYNLVHIKFSGMCICWLPLYCNIALIDYFKNTIPFKNCLSNKRYHAIKTCPDSGDSPEPVCWMAVNDRCLLYKSTRASMGAIQKGGISTGILATIAGMSLYWLLQPHFYYASFCTVIW